MRAGLGHPSDDGADLPAGVEDVTRRMMALAVSMVGRAGENAAVYAVHAGRREVVPQDVHRAMQYQSKVFLTDVTEADVAEALEDVTRACDATDSDSEEEDDTIDTESDEEASSSSSEEEDVDEEKEEEEDVEVWTVSTCACAVCAGMNEAHDTWGSYAPEDEALAYLKNMTDKILAKHH
jgi:hypothetical protein